MGPGPKARIRRGSLVRNAPAALGFNGARPEGQDQTETGAKDRRSGCRFNGARPEGQDQTGSGGGRGSPRQGGFNGARPEGQDQTPQPLGGRDP